MNNFLVPWASPFLGKDELNNIKDSFSHQSFTSGKKVMILEKKLTAYLGCKYCALVSNGTIALDLALKALKIKPNDEIIVPAMSYFSTASSVSYQNAKPVFVDIENKTFNIDPNRIEEAITRKTKAIIFIDYGGNPSDIDKINGIGSKYDIPILQDAAQSLGGMYKGKNIGANGKLSTVSFHMAKIITTIEGGAIFTNEKTIYNDILTRRNIGEPKNKKYYHTHLGTNARMTELHAGIGLAQMKKLNKFVNSRIRIAKIYDSMFNELDLDISTLAQRQKGIKNSYFFYPILVKKRDKIAKNLRDKYRIDTRIAYPMPIYRQPLYSKNLSIYKKFDCPVAEEVTSKILNLPIFPNMKNNQIKKVVGSINEIIKNG